MNKLTRPQQNLGTFSIPNMQGSPFTGLDSLHRVLAVVAVVSSIYLQRISIPGTLVGVGCLVPYVALAYLSVMGRVRLTPRRLGFGLFLVVIFAVTSVVSTTYSPEQISGGSFGLLLLMWLPFLFLVPSHSTMTRYTLKVFEISMVPIAALTICQFVLQAGFPVWADPISLLPAEWRLSGYQAAYEFRYGTGVVKANGVFFLESSFASQYLALAAIISLTGRRLLAIFFITAMIVTGGGTGIIMLLLGLVVLAAKESNRVRLLVVATVAAGYTVMDSLGLTQQILGRAGELGASNTSGSLRFVEPYEAVLQAYARVDSSAFWGLGPGTADTFAASIGVRGNFSLVPKLLLEYGIFPTILFTAFVTLVILRLRMDLAIRLPMLAMIIVLSGALIQAHTSLLLWVFAASTHASISESPPDG